MKNGAQKAIKDHIENVNPNMRLQKPGKGEERVDAWGGIYSYLTTPSSTTGLGNDLF